MSEQALKACEDWVREFVIGYNLCPFAKQPYSRGLVRLVAVDDGQEKNIMTAFLEEGQRLLDTPAEELETSLLVLPTALTDFQEYLDFAGLLESLLTQKGWEGILQIATFHPDYQFGGTTAEDAENYTNRSPWPLFHLIREDSVSNALEHYPDPERIPERNIEQMEKLGVSFLQKNLNKLRDI